MRPGREVSGSASRHHRRAKAGTVDHQPGSAPNRAQTLAFTARSQLEGERQRPGEDHMAAAPTTLKELYTADMRDLCSANDQMQKVVQQSPGSPSTRRRCAR